MSLLLQPPGQQNVLGHPGGHVRWGRGWGLQGCRPRKRDFQEQSHGLGRWVSEVGVTPQLETPGCGGRWEGQQGTHDPALGRQAGTKRQGQQFRPVSIGKVWG